MRFDYFWYKKTDRKKKLIVKSDKKRKKYNSLHQRKKRLKSIDRDSYRYMPINHTMSQQCIFKYKKEAERKKPPTEEREIDFYYNTEDWSWQ